VKARQYTEIKPLHEAPAGPRVDQGDREEALSDALRGAQLGAYDEQVIGDLVRHADDPFLRTLVSLFERVRDAGAVSVLDLELELQRRARGRRTRPAEPLPRTPQLLNRYQEDGGSG
jgi:hypothetical protein